MTDEYVPTHATHRIDISVYVDADSDDQATEIAKYIQSKLNGVPEIIRADMSGETVSP